VAPIRKGCCINVPFTCHLIRACMRRQAPCRPLHKTISGIFQSGLYQHAASTAVTPVTACKAISIRLFRPMIAPFEHQGRYPDPQKPSGGADPGPPPLHWSAEGRGPGRGAGPRPARALAAAAGTAQHGSGCRRAHAATAGPMGAKGWDCGSSVIPVRGGGGGGGVPPKPFPLCRNTPLK